MSGSYRTKINSMAMRYVDYDGANPQAPLLRNSAPPEHNNTTFELNNVHRSTYGATSGASVSTNSSPDPDVGEPSRADGDQARLVIGTPSPTPVRPVSAVDTLGDAHWGAITSRSFTSAVRADDYIALDGLATPGRALCMPATDHALL